MELPGCHLICKSWGDTRQKKFIEHVEDPAEIAQKWPVLKVLQRLPSAAADALHPTKFTLIR